MNVLYSLGDICESDDANPIDRIMPLYLNSLLMAKNPSQQLSAKIFGIPWPRSHSQKDQERLVCLRSKNYASIGNDTSWNGATRYGGMRMEARKKRVLRGGSRIETG